MALVVDDDPILRAVGCEVLRTLGFEIVEAESGEEALELAMSRLPDFVLLDVNLPGRDGFSICRELRRVPALSQIPIVVITGASEEEVIDRAFTAGATDFVHKPLDWQLTQHRVRFLMRANSAFKDLNRSQRQLQQTREIGGIGTWDLIVDSRELIVSEELRALLSLSSTTPGWKKFFSKIHADDRTAFEKTVTEAFRSERRQGLEHRMYGAGNAVRFVEHTVECSPSDSGERRIQGTVRNVTEQRQAQEQIEYLESFDAVTKLPNRKLLRIQLGNLIKRCDRENESIVVICLNLDRFDRVNRALGFAGGDALLKAVAKRLVGSVRATDVVGRALDPPQVSRLGNDVFTIVIAGSEAPSAASAAVNRIQRVFREPFGLSGQKIPLSASFGIARYPEDARDADDLLSCAASAMGRAKRAGGGRYEFFDSREDQGSKNELAVETELARALERDEFFVEYQPLCDAKTGKLTSVEALVRWNHPVRGRLAPIEFIAAAESSGLITALGQRVLRKACEQLPRWDRAGIPGVRLSANVSSHQFTGGDLAETVRSVLEETGLSPERLELELTETALIGEGNEVEEACSALRELGVGIALDDFGTGFSSLSHLVRFQIDTLKIDRSFVNRIESGGTASAVTAAVIAMARRLGITVVAEGVETPEQARFLQAEGCHLLQGYLLGKPMAPPALEEWFRRRSRG
ncbi:MAG: EAL domain-containing protein [Myxococcales bacterium]|nr:EAL domain-containing protein [Myxococcales bacterium]